MSAKMRTRAGRLKRIAALLTFTVLAILLSAQAPGDLDARVIAAAKRADVNTLDKQLPHAPFEVWLQRQVGSTARVAWESNDCGEQDGATKRDLPLCGEGMVNLPAGGKVGLQLVVGSLRKGVHGKPAVWFLYVEDQRGQSHNFRRLSDLPNLLGKLPR